MHLPSSPPCTAADAGGNAFAGSDDGWLYSCLRRHSLPCIEADAAPIGGTAAGCDDDGWLYSCVRRHSPPCTAADAVAFAGSDDAPDDPSGTCTMVISSTVPVTADARALPFHATVKIKALGRESVLYALNLLERDDFQEVYRVIF